MNRNRRILVAAMVLAIALILSACAKKAPTTPPVVTPPATKPPVTQPATTPTESTQPSAPVQEAAITSPAKGSDERTALLDAARTKLGTSAQFYVYQLFLQGDMAIGDIEPVTGGGKRMFVVWTGPQWSVAWTAPFGSAGASASAAKSAVPALSSELAGKIDWKLAKPASSATMIASLTKAAQGWSDSVMGGVGKPYKMVLVKVAKDPKGAWWGHVVVQPTGSAGNSYEAIEFWCSYKNGAWEGKVQDPEPPAPTTYFPASVTGALGF